MGVWISFLWFVWDVAFCVYTQIEVRPLTSPEWILAGSGAVCAVAVLVAEFLERESHAREVADARLTQATSHANLSGKLDLVALLGGRTFEKLAEVTNTSTSEAPTVVLAATTKIEALEKRIAELTEDTRHVTRDQRRRFAEAMPRVVPELFRSPPSFEYRGVRITHGSTLEAQNYAEELARLFSEHAITVSRDLEYTDESLNVPGLRALIANPSDLTANDRKTLALLDAAGIKYEIEQATNESPEITVLRVGKTFSR